MPNCVKTLKRKKGCVSRFVTCWGWAELCYLKGFHHKLRINEKNATDTELPLLKLFDKLPHHWQVCVELNLT